MPADRNLLDPVAEPLRQGEYLDVVHVSVDLLPPEQVVSNIAPKKLEPALGIHDIRQANYGMHENAESHRPEAAMKRLSPLDLRIAQAS